MTGNTGRWGLNRKQRGSLTGSEVKKMWLSPQNNIFKQWCMRPGEPSINFQCKLRWSCHIPATLGGTKWNNTDIMVQCNNQLPYHLQSILANQSARTSSRLIIQIWIFQSEAQTPFQAHIHFIRLLVLQRKSHALWNHSTLFTGYYSMAPAVIPYLLS